MEVRIGKQAIHQRRHRISGEHRGAQHPRSHHQRGAGRHDQHRLPAPLRRHEEHRASHYENAGQLDRITESGEHAGRQQISGIGEQQEIEGRQHEEDARGVVVGGRAGDAGHRRAEVEDRGDEAGQIGGAQAAADAEDQRNGGQEEGELHQLGGGVTAEGKGHGIEHLHALRHDIVKGDVVGKAAETEVFVGQSEMVRDPVGDRLRGERVHQVPHAVSREDDPCGARNSNGIGCRRPAKSPRSDDGNRRRVRGRRPSGPDGREEGQRRAMLSAAAPIARRISGGAGCLRMRMAPREYAVARVKAAPKRVEEEGHRASGARYNRTVSIWRSSWAGRDDWRGHCRGTEELQQRSFGAIEIAVDQLAQGGAAHRIARGFAGNRRRRGPLSGGSACPSAPGGPTPS